MHPVKRSRNQHLLLGERFLHIGQRQHLRQLRMQPGDDGRRHAGRHDETVPGHELEARQSGLSDGVGTSGNSARR
jgi:hypothetical protein